MIRHGAAGRFLRRIGRITRRLRAMVHSRCWSSRWVGAQPRCKRGRSCSNVYTPSTKRMCRWMLRFSAEALDEGDGAGAGTGAHASTLR